MNKLPTCGTKSSIMDQLELFEDCLPQISLNHLKRYGRLKH